VEGIHELLAQSAYTVGPNSNHVGLRLAGPVRHPEGLGEIVSHGVPVGAFEIPHGDELIVLGRYRTLTAGYPIVAFAATADLPLLGQAEPGRHLAFRWISREQSVERLRAQDAALRLLEQRSNTALEALGVPLDGAQT
jgi:allophanate hydrolase subunit 2